MKKNLFDLCSNAINTSSASSSTSGCTLDTLLMAKASIYGDIATYTPPTRLLGVDTKEPPRPSLFGVPIYESRHITKTIIAQTRYPKSRKKRIREKFRKKYSRAVVVPSNEIYFIQGLGYFGHPAVVGQIKNVGINKPPRSE